MLLLLLSVAMPMFGSQHQGKQEYRAHFVCMDVVSKVSP